MARNFTNFRGTDEQPMNDFAELASSLIFPGPGVNWIGPGWPDQQQVYHTGSNIYHVHTGGQGYAHNEQRHSAQYAEKDGLYLNDEFQRTPSQTVDPSPVGDGHSNSLSDNISDLQAPQALAQTQAHAASTKLSPEESAERLRTLRATLMAKRRTPDPNAVQRRVAITAFNGAASTVEASKSNEPGGAMEHKQDDKSGASSNVLSPSQSHTSTDVEALIAEHRNGSMTELTQHEVSVLGQGKANNAQPAIAAAMPTRHRVPSDNEKGKEKGNSSSSGSVEQGEILEDSTKCIVSGISPSNPSLTGPRSATTEKPQKIDTGRGTLHKSANTPNLSRTPTSANPHSLRDTSRPSDSKREDDPKVAREDYREQYSKVSRQIGDRREGGNHGSRVLNDVRRDSRADRDRVERERAADAYKRENGLVSQAGSSETTKCDTGGHVPAILSGPSRANAPSSNQGMREGFTTKQATLDNLIPESELLKCPVRGTGSDPTSFDIERLPTNVLTWLEITGFFDEEYRRNTLALHERQQELDRQQAELDKERQDITARFSRLKNGASKDDKSVVVSHRFPSSSMPPPPLPPKNDDTAQKEDNAASRNGDHAAITTSPVGSPRATILTTKRQRSSSDAQVSHDRPGDKVARTNLRDFSIDKTRYAPGPSPSLESRITRDEGPAKREYEAARARYRSRSPVSRQGSDAGYQVARPMSRAYSPPHRRVTSRGGSVERYDGDVMMHDEAYERDDRRYSNEYDYDSYRGSSSYRPYNTRGRGRGRGRAGQYQSYRGNSWYNNNNNNRGYDEV